MLLCRDPRWAQSVLYKTFTAWVRSLLFASGHLPNFALDRLSRYEATLWRQAGRILYALETLDRRKPQERMRRFWLADKIEQQ
jgi:hypothetical protein